MKQVQLKYKRWIGWGKLHVGVPAVYSEMLPTQFLASIRLSKGWIDEQTFFIQFFNLSKKLLSKIDSFMLYKLAETLDFMSDNRAVYFGFYCKTLPGGLLSPDDRLRGVSFQQFMTADTFFSWYIVTDKKDYLNRFIASLYLREDESYMPKGKEKPVDLDERTSDISKLPFDLRYSIMVNWVLIKSWLSRTYIHLFPESNPEANAQGDKVKAKPVDWLSVFDAFVGDNIASMDAYKAMPCMDAFRLLNRKIKEAKKR